MEPRQYAYNRINCLLSSIIIFSTITSFGLFLTYLLLLTTNSQFIAFNQFSSTGKCPAIYFYLSIILVVVYLGMFLISAISLWYTADILNKWNAQTKSIFITFKTSFFLAGFIQIAVGIATVIYMRALPWPLREYMADNLRSNYTGGYGMGYLDRQYDRYVDWVQINYQCCGVISYEDYRNGFYYNSFNKYTIVNIVPASCCMYRDTVISGPIVNAPLNGLGVGPNTNNGPLVNLAPGIPNPSVSSISSNSQSEYQATSRCQMKSINIYRKGCYDILMWWMESFGTLIGALSIAFGVLYLFGSLVSLNIYRNLKNLKWMVKERDGDKQLKAKVERMMNNFGLDVTNLKNFNNYHKNSNQEVLNSTFNETISYLESRT